MYNFKGTIDNLFVVLPERISVILVSAGAAFGFSKDGGFPLGNTGTVLYGHCEATFHHSMGTHKSLPNLHGYRG